MVNEPPKNNKPLSEFDNPHQPQEKRYIVDGQYLNQGYYEEVEQENNEYYQEDNPQNYEGEDDNYLPPEFVQGSEYQHYHEEGDENINPQEADLPPEDTIQGVGAIATFGTQDAPITHKPSKLSPIIPRDTIIGKSILFIIIAMCFLASLAIVSLLLVQSSVDGWTADIGKQATVQIIPSSDRNLQDDINQALEIIRATKGIAQAEALTKNETAKLLEPWIGDGIIGKDINNNEISILDELPIPALIAIEFTPEQNVDLNLLDLALKAAIPNISVDDHKRWLSQLSSIGNILKFSAFAVLLLVTSITITIIIFATDAALNSNKNSIEILFLVGAEESFITKEVRHHFLWMGLKAGVIGAAICIAFILSLGLFINIIYASQFDNLAAARILFGQITLSPYQYLYLILVPVFTTIIAGITVHLSAKKIINKMH